MWFAITRHENPPVLQQLLLQCSRRMVAIISSLKTKSGSDSTPAAGKRRASLGAIQAVPEPCQDITKNYFVRAARCFINRLLRRAALFL